MAIIDIKLSDRMRDASGCHYGSRFSYDSVVTSQKATC